MLNKTYEKSIHPQRQEAYFILDQRERIRHTSLINNCSIRTASKGGEETVKQCKKCGMIKPMETFHKDNKAKDGKFSWCKPCVKVYKKKLYMKKKSKKQHEVLAPLEPKEKRCAYCKKVKYHSQFYNSIQTPDGKQYYCKKCSNKYYKRYIKTKNKPRTKTIVKVIQPEKDNLPKLLTEINLVILIIFLVIFFILIVI